MWHTTHRNTPIPKDSDIPDKFNFSFTHMADLLQTFKTFSILAF